MSRIKARSLSLDLAKNTASAAESAYSRFDKLDGTHPWQQAVPEGCVLYSVRELGLGRVAYFNWDLAREMGLIDRDHPERMTKALEEKIIETFSLRIINEWDQENKLSFPKSSLKSNRYMATRYLQLQHPDKMGRTSGDGRCIWNGVIQNAGKVWDVSSRGTGVTSLAPGAVLAGRPLKSGNTDHGYGCGMAEIDELYAAAIMAEIFHRNGLNTERVLCIVDLGRGVGIGVRAGQNLLRPAHLFGHLRQGQLAPLKRATDYLIDRQFRNGEWPFGLHSRRRYDLLLRQVTDQFARFLAHLERDYIFAWLDWDGDNVLANAGIIDYGSVRQFGLRHDQYRYDDVDRFSTNLNEQKKKARVLVQAFAQMVDFLNTGVKKPLAEFSRHQSLKRFDVQFQRHLLERFLYQVGFAREARTRALSHHLKLVEQLYREFSFLEKFKTYRKLTRVADGVNRPAIFNLRLALAELPKKYAQLYSEGKPLQLADEALFRIMLSDFAAGRDKKLNARLSRRLNRFQKIYHQLIETLAPRSQILETLSEISRRAQMINRRDRMTGNALIHVVDELLKARRRGLSDYAIQDVMKAIIEDQVLAPDLIHRQIEMAKSATTAELWSEVLTLVRTHHEEI